MLTEKEILPFQPIFKTTKGNILPPVIRTSLFHLLKKNYSHSLNQVIRRPMKKQLLDNRLEDCWQQKSY